MIKVNEFLDRLAEYLNTELGLEWSARSEQDVGGLSINISIPDALIDNGAEDD